MKECNKSNFPFEVVQKNGSRFLSLGMEGYEGARQRDS